MIKAKFQQNLDLQQELLDTGTDTIVECTADKFWGAGCSIESKQLDNNSYTGLNTTGKLLRAVRIELRDAI